MRRIPFASFLPVAIATAAMLVAGIVQLHADDHRPPAEKLPSTVPEPDPANRLREGTKLENVMGAFKATGDRWTFVVGDGARRYGVLENLALERVQLTMRENSQAVEWSVSGVITEHQGVNYLLVSRAVLKTRVRQP